MVEVREIKPIDSQIWNDFVISHNGANYSHLFEWKMVFEQSYSLKTYYLGIFVNNLL